MLSDEQIIKFQTLYKGRFGKEISRNEAYEKGMKLVCLMELICRAMAENISNYKYGTEKLAK